MTGPHQDGKGQVNLWRPMRRCAEPKAGIFLLADYCVTTGGYQIKDKTDRKHVCNHVLKQDFLKEMQLQCDKNQCDQLRWDRIKVRNCDMKKKKKKEHALWVWRSISKRFHGEFAQRAEHQEGIFLQDMREACSAVGSLQSLSILRQSNTVNPTLCKNMHLKSQQKLRFLQP